MSEASVSAGPKGGKTRSFASSLAAGGVGWFFVQEFNVQYSRGRQGPYDIMIYSI